MADNTQLSQKMEALKKRTQVLEDQEAIRDLVVRYGLRYDLGRLDEWYDLFTDDAVFDTDAPGKLLRLEGKDEIKLFFGKQNWPSRSPVGSTHIELPCIVKVDGDTAIAIGYQGAAGVRSWRLQRVNGYWLIKETVSRRIDNQDRCREVVPPGW